MIPACHISNHSNEFNADSSLKTRSMVEAFELELTLAAPLPEHYNATEGGRLVSTNLMDGDGHRWRPGSGGTR